MAVGACWLQVAGWLVVCIIPVYIPFTNKLGIARRII
jgi:hypothetical protein